MTPINELLLRGHLALIAPRDDRGDVPGWVLVTVMTAGLVALIYGIARDEFRELLRSALNSVS
ncbi:hypothetical protein [Nocardioides coralli]|uniref:hypothetical protein n=1 Tax=Nocardioides coralli TaxID=2872154 RepID=UPI001CA390B1|nr:hypothetical protein [Nocardioides coralli]QZY28426.1 hypothetical protein K6T13_13255 [Nocardioides coralli]